MMKRIRVNAKVAAPEVFDFEIVADNRMGVWVGEVDTDYDLIVVFASQQCGKLQRMVIMGRVARWLIAEGIVTD